MKHKTNASPNHALRQEREKRGWSQKYVAERIDAPASYYVSRWERGTILPSPHYREKLCTLFGKSAQELGWLGFQQADSAPYEPRIPLSLPPVWHVPYQRNPFFTGREDVLARLHSGLHASAWTQPWALSGMGGIGKTQVVVEYAHRYSEEYQAVLWASAETPGSLMADLVNCATVLDLPEKTEQDQHKIIEAVKNWLSTHSGWLFILDNVDVLPLVKNVLPSKSAGHVVLTTREQSSGTLAHNISLEPMTTTESALFLLHRANILERHAVLENACEEDQRLSQDIARMLDGHPLALDQAGAYIEEVGCSLAVYLERYQSCWSELLRLRNTRGGAGADHPDSVATTLSLSIERIEHASRQACSLLRCCAFLHPEAIPEELFAQEVVAAMPQLEELVNPVRRDIAIAQLRRASLLQRHAQTNTLSLHRLVQVMVKESMSEEMGHGYAVSVVKMLASAFPDEREPTNWPRCQRYLAQALVGAALVEKEQIQERGTTHFLQRLGAYLYERGQYEQAETVLKQAIALLQEQEAPDQLKMADTLLALAEVSRRLHNYEQAEPLYWQVHRIRSTVLGPVHLDTAEPLNDLAIIYAVQSRYEQAENLYQQVLTVLREAVGEEHRNFVQTLFNIAVLYHRQGKDEQAEHLHRHVLEVRERLLGPDHRDLAQSLDALAHLLLEQGRFDQAYPLYQQALTIVERFWGERHPYRAFLLRNLARIYQTRKQYSEAEEALREALRIFEPAYGPEHELVVQTRQRLTEVLCEKQDRHKSY